MDHPMMTICVIWAGIFFASVGAAAVGGERLDQEKMISACAGQDVELQWTLPDQLAGHRIITANWLFEAPGKMNVTIADFLNGYFSPRTDTVSVTYLPIAGISLTDVTPKHSGRYYVIILVFSDVSGTFTSVEMITSLTVPDSAPVTYENGVHVTPGHDVIRDVNGNWTAPLYCGKFVSLGQPPVEAVWTYPNGQTMASEFDHTSSSFVLRVPVNVHTQSGVYTCGLFLPANATRCPADTSPAMGAQMTLDPRDIQIWLLKTQLESKVCERDPLDDYRLLDRRIYDITTENQRLHNRVDDIFSLHIRLDNLIDDVASENLRQNEQLNLTLTKNVQQDSQLEACQLKDQHMWQQLEAMVNDSEASNVQLQVQIANATSLLEGQLELLKDKDADLDDKLKTSELSCNNNFEILQAELTNKTEILAQKLHTDITGLHDELVQHQNASSKQHEMIQQQQQEINQQHQQQITQQGEIHKQVQAIEQQRELNQQQQEQIKKQQQQSQQHQQQIQQQQVVIQKQVQATEQQRELNQQQQQHNQKQQQSQQQQQQIQQQQGEIQKHVKATEQQRELNQQQQQQNENQQGAIRNQTKEIKEQREQIQAQQKQIESQQKEMRNQTKEIQAQQVTMASLQSHVEQLQRNLTSFMSSVNHSLSVLAKSTSCVDWMKYDNSSGLRVVRVNGQLLTVYCDQETDGGGWMVFQRRVDASVDFYRDWKEYVSGFGDLEGNFWLGLDHLYSVTSSQRQELRVDLRQWDGSQGYAKYSGFRVEGAASKYRLQFHNFTGGNAGDSLTRHKGHQFSTRDADNDPYPGHCAVDHHGAWWYYACHLSHLNGRYKAGPESGADGVVWWHFGKTYKSLKYVDMKIRPM